MGGDQVLHGGVEVVGVCQFPEEAVVVHDVAFSHVEAQTYYLVLYQFSTGTRQTPPIEVFRGEFLFLDKDQVSLLPR